MEETVIFAKIGKLSLAVSLCLWILTYYKMPLQQKKIIWASTYDNLILFYANNKGADQPVHLHSLISAFVIRYLDSIIAKLDTSKVLRFCLKVYIAEQACLSLTWSETQKTGYLMVEVYMRGGGE